MKRLYLLVILVFVVLCGCTRASTTLQPYLPNEDFSDEFRNNSYEDLLTYYNYCNSRNFDLYSQEVFNYIEHHQEAIELYNDYREETGGKGVYQHLLSYNCQTDFLKIFNENDFNFVIKRKGLITSTAMFDGKSGKLLYADGIEAFDREKILLAIEEADGDQKKMLLQISDITGEDIENLNTFEYPYLHLNYFNNLFTFDEYYGGMYLYGILTEQGSIFIFAAVENELCFIHEYRLSSQELTERYNNHEKS